MISLSLISYAVKFINYCFGTDTNSLPWILKYQRTWHFSFGNLVHWGKVRFEDAEICPQCSPVLLFLWVLYPCSIHCADSSTFFWCSSVPEAQTLKLILPLVIIPAGCLCWGLKQRSNLNIKWNLYFDRSNPRGNCSEFVCDFYNTWPKTKPSAGRVHLPGK